MFEFQTLKWFVESFNWNALLIQQCWIFCLDFKTNAFLKSSATSIEFSEFNWILKCPQNELLNPLNKICSIRTGYEEEALCEEQFLNVHSTLNQLHKLFIIAVGPSKSCKNFLVKKSCSDSSDVFDDLSFEAIQFELERPLIQTAKLSRIWSQS